MSITDQNPELQLREIQDDAGRQGREIVATYQGIASGAKASRSGLNRLMAKAMARRFDRLLVWKGDRFGRVLVDCLNNILALADHGIRFIAVTHDLDTDQLKPRLTTHAPRSGRRCGI